MKEKKKKEKRFPQMGGTGLGNECLWSTQPLVLRGAVKVQSVIVMAYLLSKAGDIKGFLLPAGWPLSQGTAARW